MISIVTVGMNHLSYLQNLFKSLEDAGVFADTEDYQMIYVDNCSTDGSVDFVKDNYPSVKILRNQKPLGFGDNNNKGILASTGEYIAIINPDIVVFQESLTELKRYLQDNPNVGIVAPQLLNPDGTVQYSVRKFINLKRLAARAISCGNDSSQNKDVNDYLCKDIDWNKTQQVDWAIGAAYMIRRDVYAHLGGFDNDYFLYMEDEDICFRCWQSGFPVIYHPIAKMIHNHLRASSKFGKKMFMHIKSMFTYFRKHGLYTKR